MPEYKAVRVDPLHFAIVPGHERSDTERVLASYTGYAVIEQHEDIPSMAAATDPRRE